MSAYADFEFDEDVEYDENHHHCDGDAAAKGLKTSPQLPQYVAEIVCNPSSSPNQSKQTRSLDLFFDKILCSSGSESNGALSSAKRHLMDGILISLDFPLLIQTTTGRQQNNCKRSLMSILRLHKALIKEGVCLPPFYSSEQVDELEGSHSIQPKLDIHKNAINSFLHICMTDLRINSSNTFLRFAWEPLRTRSDNLSKVSEKSDENDSVTIPSSNIARLQAEFQHIKFESSRDALL